VRDQIARERARIQDGLNLQVLTRWDQNMTVPDIAKALNCPASREKRIIDTFRKQQGVTIRRGHGKRARLR